MLVLLPNPHNSLKLEWVGPYTILRKVTSVDYEIEMAGRWKEKRVYHINLLKRWYPATAMLTLGDGEVGDDEETDEGMYVGDDDISDNLYPGEDG